MAHKVRILSGIQFAAPDGIPLHADLHLPQNAGAPVPAVIWLHGGGWRFGDRHLAPDLSRYFARDGCAMAAVDYRLSHHAHFPAQIEDVKTAIRWLRSIAPAHGIDPGRIGLLGSSAGGHLAALAALTNDDAFTAPHAPYVEQSSAVQAAVIGYAPTDFLQIDAHRPADGVVSDDPETLLLPRGMTRSADAGSFESMLLGAPIDSCPDKVRAANPLTYVHRGAPPFFILHGRSDTTVPIHQSELLYAALAELGNDVTFCEIDGLGHGFLNRTHLDDGPPRRTRVRNALMDDEIVQPIFPAIEAFLRTRLMTPVPSSVRVARS